MTAAALHWFLLAVGAYRLLGLIFGRIFGEPQGSWYVLDLLVGACAAWLLFKG